MAMRRCECGARLGSFRLQKNGKKKWIPFKNKDHAQCPRCYRAIRNAIRAQRLRGRKEPEIPEIP